LRKLPLHLRKNNLARLLARRPEGIFVSDFEQGQIRPDLFLKACEFGLEGLVCKHRDRAYRAGTSPNWVKVKNPRPCDAEGQGGVFMKPGRDADVIAKSEADHHMKSRLRTVV
jgi:ATP-dependent DNA ligase